MRKLPSLSVQTRLFVIFGLLALAAAIIAVIGLVNAVRFQEQMAAMRDSAQALERSGRARSDLAQEQIAAKNAILSDDPAQWGQVFTYNGQLSDYLDSEKLAARNQEEQKTVQEIVARYEVYADNAAKQQPVDKEALNSLAATLADLRPLTDQLTAAVDKAEASDAQADWENVARLDAAADVKIQAIVGQIDALVADQNSQLEAAKGAVNSYSSLGWTAVLGAIALFLVLLGLAVWIVNRQVSAPLKRLTAGLPAILNGSFEPGQVSDLPKRQDEIGFLAREYLRMAAAVSERHAALERQAEELRQRIRP